MNQAEAPPVKNPITSVRLLRAAIMRAARQTPTQERIAQITDAAKALKADRLPWVANFLAKHSDR